MIEKILIGIDGGVSNGFAVWSKAQRKLLAIDTLSFWDCIDGLNKFYDSCTESGAVLVVVIEDVGMNRPTFVRKNTNERMMQKISQNVGGVKAYTQLIIEWCQRKGISIIRVRPTKKSATKLSAEAFNKITGWQGKSSSHGRDAAMLVVGL